MKESSPFYFSDFFFEAGVEPCYFCGTIEDCCIIEVDEPANRQPVCAACIEAMEGP